MCAHRAPSLISFPPRFLDPPKPLNDDDDNGQVNECGSFLHISYQNTSIFDRKNLANYNWAHYSTLIVGYIERIQEPSLSTMSMMDCQLFCQKLVKYSQ